MDVTLFHFYPDLMSLYGSYANVAVLRRHLEDLGNTVTVTAISPGAAETDLSGADFVFMGAGTERSQRFAAGDFGRYGAAVKAAAADGVSMLFAGTAMELLGTTVTTAQGETYDGIGLGGFATVQGPRRIVGDVYGKTALYDGAVVGFMNKCGVVSGVETPLLTQCAMGFGNEAEGGPEGFCQGNVVASQLTGPLLVKNPRLLDAVIAAIYRRRGEDLPAQRTRYPYEEDGYAITAEQLRLRCKGAE